MNITQQWNQEDSDYIKKKVIAYNEAQLPDEMKHTIKNISFIVRNDDGEIVGGIVSHIHWRDLHVDFLWVDESLKGQGYGRILLENVEKVAIEDNCRLITLDTFSFQAPEFYKKYGYQIYGVIKEHPVEDINHYFFEKRLTI